MTSLLIARGGVPTPDTFVLSTREGACECVAREAGPERPLVLKPLFGSQGEGLRLIARPEDLPQSEEVAGVYYLQRYVVRRDGRWRDYRVFICGGHAIAGMIREGDGWITNVRRGGRPLPWAVPPAAARVAEAAAVLTAVDYSGIDLVEDGEGGYLVLEVNSMPAWSGLQQVTDVDIAGEIAGGFVRAVRAAHAPVPRLAAAT
jgi:ribosomal protein S6--L-glutamate ligase